MKVEHLSIEKLNDILNTTINSITESKDEIFEIVNHARIECKRLEEELEILHAKVRDAILEVKELESRDRKNRINLSNKSKNFDIYDEQNIKDAYEIANETRIELLIKREEEKNFIERRKETEIRLKHALEIYKKAENINKQISVATEYLTGNVSNIVETVDELSRKHYLGIKIIEAQEEERYRLARDIHDGPAQSLANVIVKAELCERLLELDRDGVKDEILNLKEVVRGTLKDVRKIIYDLRPMSLDDLGLIPTLEKYVSTFEEDTGIKIIIKVLGKYNNLASAIQVALFRIVQESLSNISKHSGAKTATLIIEKSQTKLNMSITDDGVGFDPENYKNELRDIRSGFGLMNIKERVGLLNGNINITSSTNTGTKLSIFIPLSEGD